MLYKRDWFISAIFFTFPIFSGTVFGAIFRHTMILKKSKNDCIFSVVIPGDQKLVGPSPVQLTPKQAEFTSIYEYTAPDNSEAIIIASMSRKKILSATFCRALKEKLSSRAHTIKIKEEEYFEIPKTGIQVVRIVLTYTNKESEVQELLYLEFHAGPTECSFFQYNLTLSGELREEVALEKARTFARENVKTFVSVKK